jgi:carbamoyltransferase
MVILGISAYYHDSAASIIRDGDIVAAAQEERFTRIKQDSSFPVNAIRFCLKQADVIIDEVDKIVFYDDPKVKFKRIQKTYAQFFPKSIPFILKSFPVWFTKKRHWKKILQEEFLTQFNTKVADDDIVNTLHHRSHAASAFFPSPFAEAAVLILDGVGEFDTMSLWSGNDNKLSKIASVEFPHSIGLLYSAITYYTGFKVNSGEYKVMGLAPYGEPKYVDLIKQYLITINEEGTFTLNMDYFDFATGTRMTSEKFHKLFGREPREPESAIGQFEMDMARSIQDVTEEVMVKLARWAWKETGKKNLCLAGGVALNCVGNGKILREKIFDDVWIQPAAGDAGGSLGCALNYYYDDLDNQRNCDLTSNDTMKGAYLGPEYSGEDIEYYLKTIQASYVKYDDFDQLVDMVTDAIIDGKVVGWHQGRMEFGPRALGGRSILGDPRNTEMQSTMNLKIKYRESFRPFAPSILSDKVNDWFEIDHISPYMLLVAPIQKSKHILMTEEQKCLFGIEKLKVSRSKIPAVTHVDYSARIQTVHKETNPKYHQLLTKFDEKTGCPILTNTSFNVRGEPIVCTPEDSYRCFMRTEMDMLVLNDFVLLKADQPRFEDTCDWKEEFELD